MKLVKVIKQCLLARQLRKLLLLRGTRRKRAQELLRALRADVELVVRLRRIRALAHVVVDHAAAGVLHVGDVVEASVDEDLLLTTRGGGISGCEFLLSSFSHALRDEC